MRFTPTVLAFGVLTAVACSAPDGTMPTGTPSLAARAPLSLPDDDGTSPDMALVSSLVDKVNARLEKGASKYRLSEATFFVVGRGVNPYRRLRTGARWNDPTDVTYAIDEKDVIATGPFGSADRSVANSMAAIREGWDVWGTLGTTLRLREVHPDMANADILDAIVLDAAGNCVDFVDTTSPVVDSYNPATGSISFTPVAQNVFGGWLAPAYFQKCLGSANIIGVTWSFSDVDTDSDAYPDRVYTEMYYNPRFRWVNSLSPFLSSVMDVASIVTHEAGHAQGLGHFGGPNDPSKFFLGPQGQLFDPEAVMNPFYVGGTKRTPFSTDVAALTTLYQSNNK